MTELSEACHDSFWEGNTLSCWLQLVERPNYLNVGGNKVDSFYTKDKFFEHNSIMGNNVMFDPDASEISF